MRKLLWFTIGFCAACLLVVYALPEAWLPWAAGGGAILPAALAFLGLRRRASRSPRGSAAPAEGGSSETGGSPIPCGKRLAPAGRRVVCAALGLAFGLLWSRGYDLLVLSPARALAGELTGCTVELSAYPEQIDRGQRAEGVLLTEGRRIPVRISLYGSYDALEPGDRLVGDFKLRPADRTASGETWYTLQAKGILLIGYAKQYTVEQGGRPFRYFPARWSKAVFDRLGELIPADAAGLPQAMLTGNRSGLSPALREDLSRAGASHVVAVSGLHVSMLMAVLILLTGRGKLSLLLGLPLLALFVLMTGASPSVIRASLMLGLFLLAPLFHEENDPPTSLALAALLILLANPWAAANLSFQLSFGAVAGLLLVTRPLLDYLLQLRPVKKLLKWPEPKSWPRLLRGLPLRLLRGLVRGVCASLSATLGALIFTAPIAAAVFGSMPVYSVLTNLFVLPLASLVLSAALLVLALGLVSSVLGGWAGWLLAWPVRGVLGVCRLFSRLPGHSLWMDTYGIAFLGFACLLVLLILLLREKKYGLPLLCLLTGLIAAVGLQQADMRRGSFSLAALDVGQGQCVCVSCGDFSAVIDCGGSGDYSGGQAAAWLDRHGAEQIDALILTHYDRDHMDGVPGLLARIPAAELWLPEVPFDPENRAAVEAAALACGARLRYVTEDQLLRLPGGQLQLFAPVSDRNDNAACVCVLYSAGEYDMLITGDLDSAGEHALLARHALPPVELYVAGHHGSARSSSEALLEAIRPETVFVSVGQNAYGLPNAEALARIEAVGAAIYRTDEYGDLELTVHEP